MTLASIIAFATAVPAAPVLAAATAPAAPATGASPVNPAAAQADQAQEIIITAPVARSERDVLAGTSVISGEELTRDVRPSIGETLARQPGVSATSFGPSASRPILRGLQGDRVRVLTDGIGSIDVSNTSVDHAVAIDPLLAERVEVLRGPAALLYGSSAVGGVVNVINARIPRSVPAKGYRLNGQATYASAASERSGGMAGDVAVGGPIVLHVDGSYLKSDDLTVPGYLLSPIARARALASVGLPQPGPEPIDFAANAAARGTLANSAARTWTAGAGAAIVNSGGSLGIAYSHYASLYGVPIRYATQPDEGQEAPRLDINQNRLDLRGEVKAGGLIDSIRLRVGHARYRHYELEPDGAIGTAFSAEGTEARLELVQAKRGAWSGASGVQYFARATDVVGDEAFLPPADTSQTGFFTLQQADFGALKAEGGLRYEVTGANAQTLGGDARFFRGERRFRAVSGSIGASYEAVPGWRLGINLSRTERAPTAEELFANGPHGGTQAYQLGDPGFGLERSTGIEATLHGHGDGFSVDASAYYTDFSGYIFEDQVAQAICEAAAAPSGRTVDLPCFQARQTSARYWGLEGDLSLRLARLGGTEIHADLLGDYVHAELAGGAPVPRIPPLRLLGGVEAQADRWTARAEVERVFAQRRITAFETPTDGYTSVNLSASWKPFASDRTNVVLSANNLFDTDQRRHASYLKDYAPLAGRDVRLTVRFGI